MNIRNLNSSASPLTTRKVGSATDAYKSASNASAKKSEAPKNAPIEDRVELSEAARAQSKAKGGELEQAHEALLDMPPLDPKRKEDILRRVQSGYYSQPDVLKQVAQRLSADLTGLGSAK
jgi:hypothetical protein